ncbi:MAG: hypothetical protein JNK90_30160 [Planctomycetaceae bacterium]|nr:hypothetical protein [Planctomycetaceae bacterium]
MPVLNWDIFEQLPGSATSNWELLCRELVRRNYEKFGVFRSVVQQAGIEFHLDITDSCSLGEAAKHWGWQCKWYKNSSGELGKVRRTEIEDAINKTEKYQPTITDWVLWTRRSLTPKDQKWFHSIKSKFQLRLWAEEEVLGLLTGEAEVLRATYFGELVITAEKFSSMHSVAIAPIRKRWEPLLHVEVDVERSLKAALGTPGTWPVFRESAERLEARAATIEAETVDLRGEERKLSAQAADLLKSQSEHLSSLANALDEGGVAKVRLVLANPVTPEFKKHHLRQLAARLRSVDHRSSLSVANAIWEISNYFSLLEKVSGNLEQKFFAVVGDAGFGKTYLAAELTKSSEDFPGGVLLLAKYLSKNGTLDELAKRVPFGGKTMEQLLEAVDAAGARLGRRIPIVIDGLNESENPRDWKDLLESLKVQLNRTSNCVVVVTLRSAVADLVLPSDVTIKNLTGFKDEPKEAIRKYFDYYKIDATDAQLPLSRLTSPLFLSLFCKATNPDRKKTVGVERIPRSLTAVFESYRQVVVSRAAEALNIAQQDVESALERVGLALWEQNARSFDFDELRKLVGDQPREWINSLARVLEEEGVLSRDPYPQFIGLAPDGHRQGNQVSALLYDAFAGFVISDAILALQGSANFPSWISKNWNRLDFSNPEHHPFTEDILNGFVGLLPRRHHCQFWKTVPSPLRKAALLEATHLEAERIDEETLGELVKLCKYTPAAGLHELFDRLWSTRAALNHPLNANFLHNLLFDMEVAERDLRWTEWLRHNREEVKKDLEWLEDRWLRNNERDEADHLFARWVSWTLTSSVRYLRDQATRSLYWFGLGTPQRIFEFAIEFLDTNDAYVTERMFAVAYGVVMGRQRKIGELADPLKWFLAQINSRLLGQYATTPINHWMTREYIRGIFAFAEKLMPTACPDHVSRVDGKLAFGQAPYVAADDVKYEYTGYLGHDFENDEIGRLCPDRRKYDNSHPVFSKVATEIKGRIWALGWRHDRFEQIDKRIAEDQYRPRNEPAGTDRYATKYARIALQETAGVIANYDPNRLRRTDRLNPMVDIDPSFPRIPPQLPIVIPSWVGRPEEDNKEWLGAGDVTVPEELLRMPRINDQEGPWIAVNGFMKMTNKLAGRQTFGFIRGILVAKVDVDHVVSLLESQDYIGNFFIPEEPEDYYTFAGEIPWSDEFAYDDEVDETLGSYRGRIGDHWGNGPIVEILSHRYAWEDYHSCVNRAGGSSVPSKSFSREFDLRSISSGFMQFDSFGRLAAISLSPPENFDRSGNILYLREDLLIQYARSRNSELVCAVWGERNLTKLGYRQPDWVHDIYQRHGHVWRRIVTHALLKKSK